MTAFKKDTQIDSFPAYSIFHREERSGTDAIDVTHGDILGIRVKFRDSFYYHNYTVQSVMTSCAENNECPIEGYNRAIDLGHEVYWLMQNSVAITSGKQPQKKVIQISIGDKINFLGKKFEIYAQANDNLGLKEIVEDIIDMSEIRPSGPRISKELGTLQEWADIIVKD